MATATSLLEICQNISYESGISIDTSIVGSTDKATLQLLAICNRVAREMCDAFAWPQLQKEGTVTLVTAQTTYALPADLNYAYHETFWNQNNQWAVYGPYSPQDRQFLQSGIIASYPYQRYTFRGATSQEFEIDPPPTADDNGKVIAFEYQSLRPLKPLTWAQGLSIDAVGTYIAYNGNFYTSTNTGTTGATPPTHTSSTASDDTITWQFYDGDYAKFTSDDDEPVINPKTFEQGVLERFSERHGVMVTPRYDQLIQRDMEKALPGKYIDMLARPKNRYPNAPGTEWAS